MLIGSHIDPGGAFDGTLGVLGGIKVVTRTRNDAGISTLRDIGVGFFAEQEGVRSILPSASENLWA